MPHLPSPTTPRPRRWITPALLALTTLLMSARLLAGVNRYAVNILFWDQWDFWNPMFRHQGYLALFLYQHAHHQGLGFVLTAALAHLTAWNTRTECFMIAAVLIAAVLIAALLAALTLRRAVLGTWEWTDLLWPVVFLSPWMLEAIVHVPNLSHGIMPLLLLLLFCLAWGIPRRTLAYPLLLLLDFNCTFTGFGVFLGLVTPLLLALDTLAFWRGRNYRPMTLALIALALSFLSLLSFFPGYVFDPAVPGFQFPDPHWPRYPQFIALQFAYLVGLHNSSLLASALGTAALLIVLAVFTIHLRRLLQPRPPAAPPPPNLYLSHVIVTLIAFGLLFTCFCAVGRLVLGVQGGEAPRYLPLLVGTLLAVYLHFASQPRGIRRNAILSSMVLILLIGHAWPRPAHAAILQSYTDGKRLWKQTYLATSSIAQADRASHFPIHPNPAGTHLQSKLDYLRTHHLNLFLDTPATRPAP